MSKRTVKRSPSSDAREVETHPRAGETVTYRYDAEVDRALGLSEAKQAGPAKFEKAIAEAASKGFVMRGKLESEGSHVVVIERPPKP